MNAMTTALALNTATPVPVLTEVVETRRETLGGASELALDEAQIVQRVLLEVQRQFDMLLEGRLREALTAALERVGEALVQEARGEVAATLRDAVTRVVSQEMSGEQPLRAVG